MQKVEMLAAAVLLCALTGLACAAPHEAFTDPAKAGPDFAIQGEYLGTLALGANDHRMGAQVIALGDHKFAAVVYSGGLPGEGWTREKKRDKMDGQTEGGKTRLRSENATGEIHDGKLVLTFSDGQLRTLDKVERRSPTLEAKPPAAAIVLFDGTNADHFVGGKMTEDHHLIAGTMTKKEFKDFILHVEFRLPFMPTAREQGRGNSGVYLQNRYEVQVLDSFGLEGADNECGAIYKFKAPSVNMCYPPLAWQTYDVDFTAARFDGQKKTQNARVTIEHNGVKILDGFEIPDKTPGGADTEAPGRGPFALQLHGNPVVYRNMWAIEKKP